MLLPSPAVGLQPLLRNPNYHRKTAAFYPDHRLRRHPSYHHYSSTRCYAFSAPKHRHRHLTKSSSSLSNATSLEKPNSTVSLRYASVPVLEDDDDLGAARGGGGGASMVTSASALATAIRKASSSPVEFVQTIERDPKRQGLVLPSPDFQMLCLDQLDLFRRTVHPCALLSVYVRPAGSYVMDRLELRRVTFYPVLDGSDIVVLVGNFSIPTGLRIAEAVISNQEEEVIPEHGAWVFPMVKHPFVVGFLVAELPKVELGMESREVMQLASPSEPSVLPPTSELKPPVFHGPGGNGLKHFNFSTEQRLNAMSISRSIARAYVLDQKEMLLQQTSWQNSIRMSNLIEQIRGPLSSIRTLIKMLSVQMKRSEISSDIVEDIIVQGDHMRETLELMQDAVYLTKANILRYNEESLKKMGDSDYAQPGLSRHQVTNDFSSITSISERQFGEPKSPSSAARDLEMPMPPLALAALQQHNIRPCNVSDVLVDLVGAVELLAHKQRRTVEFYELSRSLQVAVEEAALRQALGNLIEGALLRTPIGGKVGITSVEAPAGGALVIIDDDGPDMHYMMQMHSLTPFGGEMLSDGMVEDNMAWNFVAGITVAREILEGYGCVVRIISPRFVNAAVGVAGTRIEVWLPCVADSSSDHMTHPN
ncbi:hypothetical protein Dimus_015152 [Dionaea muscipula]